MATETTTITLPLDHLYYLTVDSNNQTGYTLDEVQSLIDEKGGSFEIEATITHPVPPPYTIEGDIAAHQERISNNEQYLTTLREQFSSLEEVTDEYTRIEEQIASIEQDIQNCEDHIQSLQTT
jgi:prefoldin subunit 5